MNLVEKKKCPLAKIKLHQFPKKCVQNGLEMFCQYFSHYGFALIYIVKSDREKLTNKIYLIDIY